MPNYLLLLHTSTNRPRPSSPDAFLAVTKEYMAWTDRIRAEGRHKAGDKLTDDPGKVITGQGARPSVTDGPYAESKEVVGGYYIVTASDYEDACKLAATCPHLKFGGRIEVRQIENM
jgi:hypothetical protein